MGKAIHRGSKEIKGGLVVTPKTLATVPVLADGQVAPVTDQGPVALMVRKSGVLVPAVKVITTEPIFMVVNRLTGATPPAGTIVRNQAEYDALGAPLKLMQDALNILPSNLGDYVRVRLVAGDHWADPTTLYCLFSVGRMFDLGGKTRTVIDPVLGSVFRSRILFYGDTSVYTASQSGTYVGKTITCPTGTWTVNELKGKWVWFLTGTGAGSKVPIRSNTATTIELSSIVVGSGAGTFEVRQNDSTILPTTNGTDTRSLFHLGGTPGVQYLGYFFYDLNICTAAKKNVLILAEFTTIGFTRCSLYLGSAAAFAGQLIHDIGLSYCHLTVDGGFPFTIFGGLSGSSIYYSMIRGKVTGATHYLLLYGRTASLLSYDSTWEPLDGAYTEAMLGVSAGVFSSYLSVFDGLGTARGLETSVGGATTHGPTVSFTGLQIDNCTTAISAGAGTIMQSAGALSGSGNTKAFSLSDGAEVVLKKSATTIAGTTYATIDGQDYLSSDFAAAGDGVEGRYGSSLDMT